MIDTEYLPRDRCGSPQCDCTPPHTYEHHPRCDDNGWDHRGPCILEDLP